MKWIGSFFWWLKAKLIGVPSQEVAEYYEKQFPPIKRPQLSINPKYFDCICGKYKDIELFKCIKCSRIYAFCGECTSFYTGVLNSIDLSDFNISNSEKPAAKCICGHEFEFYFPRNPNYFVTADDIRNAGFASVLKIEI